MSPCFCCVCVSGYTKLLPRCGPDKAGMEDASQTAPKKETFKIDIAILEVH